MGKGTLILVVLIVWGVASTALMVKMQKSVSRHSDPQIKLLEAANRTADALDEIRGKIRAIRDRGGAEQIDGMMGG